MLKQNKKLTYLIYFVILVVAITSIRYIRTNNTSKNQANKEQVDYLYHADATIDDIKLKVLNGCGDNGVAGRYSWYITTELKGYDALLQGNALNFNYENTSIIIYNEEAKEKIKNLATLLGINQNFIIDYSNRKNDMDATVIIGKDYKNISSYKKTESIYYP